MKTTNMWQEKMTKLRLAIHRILNINIYDDWKMIIHLIKNDSDTPHYMTLNKSVKSGSISISLNLFVLFIHETRLIIAIFGAPCRVGDHHLEAGHFISQVGRNFAFVFLFPFANVGPILRTEPAYRDREGFTIRPFQNGCSIISTRRSKWPSSVSSSTPRLTSNSAITTSSNPIWLFY